MNHIADEKSKDGRISKERYYVNIAEEVSKRGTCLSLQGGAVIVRDDQIISTGYIGSPRGTLSSYDRKNCLRRELNVPSGQQYELCRSVHAEQNAIINAARAGVSTMGADMFMYGKKIWNGENALIDMAPCFICKKMIINAGIKRIISNTKEGKIVITEVKDIIDDWQKNDLISSNVKYSSGAYSKKE